MSKNNTKYRRSAFIRICIANLLLYSSLYTLLPVIPAIMYSTTDSYSIQQVALHLFYFIGGVALVGPFLFYIQDKYQRKSIAIFSYLGVSVSTFLCKWINLETAPFILILYGVFCTIATSIGITIAVDVSPSEKRNLGNKIVSWTGRFGFLIGIILCCFLLPSQYNSTLIYTSATLPLLAVTFILTIKLHFRAPMDSSLLHLDRFLLIKSWPFMINLMVVAIVISSTIALFYHLASTKIPPLYYLMVLIGGYLSSGFIVFSFIQRIQNKLFIQTLLGILCIGISYPLFAIPEFPYLPNYLLGLGIGLIVPEFLSLFVKISTHCQRGTANTSQSISWEIGLILGIISYYYVQASEINTLHFIITAGIFSVVFFLLVSYPYFIHNKLRK